MKVETCKVTGKNCYSHRQSITVMKQLRRNPFLKRERPVRVYRCEHCDRWHMTSQPEPEENE